MYVDHTGLMTCKQYQASGDIQQITLHFLKAGWNRANQDVVEGEIPVRTGSEHKWILSGKWSTELNAYNQETGETIQLWKANPPIENPELQYHFTNFAIPLNEITDSLRVKLPSTDTRLRPDQRAHENGEADLAASEKHRLEEKQRAARKAREKAGEDYESRYLTKKKEEITGEFRYALTRDYWQERQTGNWGEQLDLF